MEFDVVDELPVMAEPRAALRLCVVENLSGAFPWSMLGLAFFKGLPTIVSDTVLSAACDPPLGVGIGCDVAAPNSAGVSLLEPSCDVSGVEASGSAECALLSCCLTSVSKYS